jgi:hypothetical protein
MDLPEVGEAAGALGMIWSQAGLKDDERTLEVATGGIQVALASQDRGQVVEAAGGAGVVGTACLVDGKGALLEGLGAVQITLGFQDKGESLAVPDLSRPRAWSMLKARSKWARAPSRSP